MALPTDRTPHARGTRGEKWVVAQLLVMAFVAIAPLILPRTSVLPDRGAWRIAGIVLLAIGAMGGALAMARLGPNLTPYPRPRRRGVLVTAGPYAVVRHPIYTSVVTMAIGWALAWGSMPTLGGAAALLILFDLKSRREERWLVERFPAYLDYQRRVRKLIPFLY